MYVPSLIYFLFVSSVKPHFKVHPQNATAYEGYPVMIHCVANGDPEPTIQWDKNSKVNSFDLNRFKVRTDFYLCVCREMIIVSVCLSLSFFLSVSVLHTRKHNKEHGYFLHHGLIFTWHSGGKMAPKLVYILLEKELLNSEMAPRIPVV